MMKQQFNYLVLDTRKSVEKLRNNLNKVKSLPTNDSSTILLICDLLNDEEEAKLELSDFGNIEFLEHVYDKEDEYILDTERMIRFSNAFGLELLIALQRLKAYRDGMLQFKFYKMLGGDIIMKRIGYDETPL